MTQGIRQIDISRVEPSTRGVYNRAILIALIGNALLLVLKAWAARVSGSSALYSDTANSAADLAYSLLMMVGLWLSLRPPDRSHPHGHERIESLVTVAIGAFMAVAGYEALRGALVAWRAKPNVGLQAWLLAVPLLTALVKTGMYISVRHLGRLVQSAAILATALDHLSDIATSAVVLIGLVAGIFRIMRADAIAGLLVAVWILWQAARVLLDGTGQLIGKAASRDEEARVVDTIMGVPGVEGIDKVVIEYVGPRVRVDIHVYVDGEISIRRAHEISHAVRDAVQALDGVDHAFVHVEPAESA
ncbi:MAG: cation diffusion facilitator family transporter [Anaerolineae bacterium]|jgi:cation diffusion facilitator family transporter